MIYTFEEMCNDDSICNYCFRTDYSEHKSYATPDGYCWCEGAWCDEAYESYLDENEITANIVTYASKVKLMNREEVNEYTA